MKAYFKNDGKLYKLNAGGAETLLAGWYYLLITWIIIIYINME